MDTLTLEIQLLCLMQVLFSVDPVQSVGLLILFLPTNHPIGIVLHILVCSIFSVFRLKAVVLL